jgi:hypothetical protein
MVVLLPGIVIPNREWQFSINFKIHFDLKLPFEKSVRDGFRFRAARFY